MKRVLLALALLVMVSGLCWASLHNQVSNTKFLISMTEEMETAFKEGATADCLELSRRFVAEFQERTRYFPFYMRHSDIVKIEETVIALPIYLETDEVQHFQAELAKCRNQLEKLYELELPKPENIL